MSKLKIVCVIVVDSEEANEVSQGLNEVCQGLSEIIQRMKRIMNVYNWSVAVFDPQNYIGIRELIENI